MSYMIEIERMWMNTYRGNMRMWYDHAAWCTSRHWRNDAIKNAQRNKRKMIKRVDTLTQMLYPNGLPHQRGQLELF